MSRDPQLDRAIGAPDGSKTDFDTPDVYIAGSVWHYLNGIQVDRDDPFDGLIELGGTAVRLRVPPETGDDLFFYYFTGQPSAHGYPTPPKSIAAIELKPKPNAAIDLKPEPANSEVVAQQENVPDSYRAVVLAPRAVAAIELVPRPVSAEEVE